VVVESRDPKTLTLEVGKSWFQLVPVIIHTGDLNRVDHVVDDTARGSGGFGSTGNKGDTASAAAAVADSAPTAATSTTCDNVVMEVGEAAKPATDRLE
jgi:hypothetical protein